MQYLFILIKYRFILALVLIGLGVVVSFTSGLGWSWLLLIPGIILLVTHFLFGTVGLAAKELQMGNIEEAERQLGQIKKPNWLIKMYQGYFYYIKGMIAMQRNQPKEAEEKLKMALDIGLPTSNEEAMVCLNLANLNYNRRNFKQARIYYNRVKDANPASPEIKKYMEQLKEALRHAK